MFFVQYKNLVPMFQQKRTYKSSERFVFQKSRASFRLSLIRWFGYCCVVLLRKLNIELKILGQLSMEQSRSLCLYIQQGQTVKKINIYFRQIPFSNRLFHCCFHNSAFHSLMKRDEQLLSADKIYGQICLYNV